MLSFVLARTDTQTHKLAILVSLADDVSNFLL
jgi:hypothetical protein